MQTCKFFRVALKTTFGFTAASGLFFGGVHVGIQLREQKGFNGYRITDARGDSMAPTTVGIGKLNQKKYFTREYGLNEKVQRNDIVSLRRTVPEGTGSKGSNWKVVVKRVIGLENERVWNDRKREWVDVPEGHVFVMGDNRKISKDSRNYGPVKTELIRRKVICQYKPFKMCLKDRVNDDSKIVQAKRT